MGNTVLTIAKYLTKVISGGQTGADLGGLMAAKARGIPTGGTMPKGFLNENGYQESFKHLYGMTESDSPRYPTRTKQNVLDSDGTIQIAGIWKSQGELLTTRYLRDYPGRHRFACGPRQLNNQIRMWGVEEERIITPHDVAIWIVTNKIRILNVAGNAESTWYGIQDIVFGFMRDVFDVEYLGALP